MPAEIFDTASCVFTLVIPCHAEISASTHPACSFLFCCVMEDLCERVNHNRVVIKLRNFSVSLLSQELE